MFPNERAAEIAVSTVCKYYEETGSQIKVIFNVYKDEDLDIYSRILFVGDTDKNNKKYRESKL